MTKQYTAYTQCGTDACVGYWDCPGEHTLAICLKYLMNCKSSDEQICKRFLSLLKTMYSSPNERVRYVVQCGVNSSSTLIGENLTYIKCKLRAAYTNDSLVQKQPFLNFHELSNEDNCVVSVIQELMISDCVLNKYEKTALICHLCIL
jgi:hypothetical protein